MIAASNYDVKSVAGTTQPGENCEQHWYAVYTNAKHEKRVALQVCQRSIENFLPLYESVRQWNDRRMRLELPLFPGYVFVRLALRDRLQVLRIPGVVRLVGFNGAATALPDEEIEGLRRALANGLRAEPHPYLTVGRRVRIMAGPLAGREGLLKRWKGDLRVVLSTELIRRSISVEIDISSVAPIHESKITSVGSQGQK